jgi:EmrB/QacA subfamily drug resistance transporter
VCVRTTTSRWRPRRGVWRSLALSVLCLCALTAGIDLTITNVALPAIGRALDARTNELQWTVDAYNIVLAGMLVLGGAVADRYGRRRVFLASYALFALASLAAAYSPSTSALIASRGVMGLGAAGVTAPALAIIASMYPPEERGRAIGSFVVFGASGLALGPILGGLLLDHFWWGSVFLVNVPIVAAGIVLGARTIPESRAPVPAGGRPPLDVVGAVLSVVGLGALLFGVIEGPGRGWTAPEVAAALGLGAATLVGFVVWELRAHAPLFDVRILGRPPVATGAVTLLMAYLLLNSFLFLNPQYLRDVRGEQIVVVGMLFLPFAAVFGFCSLQAQRAVRRFGARATITTGLVVVALASAVLAGTGTGPLWKMLVGSILSSAYVRSVDADLSALGAEEADKARGSLQGALEVAATLPPSADSRLTSAAQDAFAAGATIAYGTVAALAVLAAVAAWFALGRSARS